MKTLQQLSLTALLFGLVPLAGAQTTFTDSFNSSHNYLTSGINGTIWDGIYMGSGDFAGESAGTGATIQCDANTPTANELTIQTTGTDWEGTGDNGFFLFKLVSGDFSASVQIITPFNNGGYNTAGLQARAFSTGGTPFNGSENFVSWTRFDEYGFANYLRSNTNGTVRQINPGGTNVGYWVRMDRIKGTNFNFYIRTNITDPWFLVQFTNSGDNTYLNNVTNLGRSDFANQTLEVGIIHATFAGQLGVQFANFSITQSNITTVTAPTPDTNLTISTNANTTLSLSWLPGNGAGSVVVLWTGTNMVKEAPADGITYTGNTNYGLGTALPATNFYVVYSGTGTNVTVTNLSVNTTYYAAAFAYNGSGTSLTYSHTPATNSINIPARAVNATANLLTGNVSVSFSANPGEWYWLQYTDSLNPINWQNVGVLPSIGTNLFMTLIHTNGAGANQRFYRIEQLDPAFNLTTGNGTISSLVYTDDVTNTQYLAGNLGEITVRYGVNGTTWNTFQASPLSGGTATYATSSDGTLHQANYHMTTGLTGGPLVLESDFKMQQAYMTWTLSFTNNSSSSVIIGDLVIPLPMNTGSPQYVTDVFKHSVVNGSSSFFFWMRNNSVGPYLLMTPDNNTKFEYFDDPNVPVDYEAYIHSAVTTATATNEYPTVTNANSRWRFPSTSVTLAPGATVSHVLKFQWVNDYNGVRQALVNEGKVDVHVAPGMTIPTNLFAQFALNTTQQITSITAEFPSSTSLEFLGTNGPYQLYQVQFSQLGENMLTVNYGVGQTMYLEFMVTEPIETLFKKRAAYIVSHQQWTGQVGGESWFNGLYADWNENDQVLNSPSNTDTLGTSFQIYEIASDDAGESRPAYMAEKESVYAVQSEVSSMDLYLTNYVWPPQPPAAGMQRETNETDAYGVYGIDNWLQLRNGNNLSLGRTYDYPHFVDMYLSMYRTAKYNPQITTAWPYLQYLTNAWGTALAMYTVAGAGNSTPGLMSEVVYSDLLAALQTEGMTSQYNQLLPHWENKVAFYATGNPNLFGSEYGFDSTGFEATHAFSKYAYLHAGSDATMGSANPALFRQEATNFMLTEVTANMFDRGFLEPAYYHYGSDFRDFGSDEFCLSYMTQMGGWSLLDYAEYFANTNNQADFLRLGYGSFLAGWAIMNTGTPASQYGFWYHGPSNDGACGGGYEPQSYIESWLGGQPTHRGPWYYSAEQNLGFCGAVREAATVLYDDPIFSRFCYGGLLSTNGATMQIIPLDGIRRRFHALLNNGALHVTMDNDRFVDGQPIVLNSDLSGVSFQIETDNPGAHNVSLHLYSSVAEPYTIVDTTGGGNTTVATGSLPANLDTVISIPIPASSTGESFTVSF